MTDGCPNAAQLAEYVDGALVDAERADIDTHLTSCADCRTVVIETTVLMSRGEEAGRRAGGVRVVPFRSRRSVIAAAGALGAAAAAVMLMVYVWRPQSAAPPVATPAATQPDLQARAQDALANRLQQGLVAAAANEPTRLVQARLAGGFKYAQPPMVLRGSEQRRESLTVRTAAHDVIDNRTLQTRTDLVGAAYLLDGDADKAIASMESAPPTVGAQSNLAAAYIERARRDGSQTDYQRAMAAAREALQQSPTMLEARFNLALALEGLQRYPEAREEWGRYLASDSSSEWAAEAREHLRSLTSRPAR